MGVRTRHFINQLACPRLRRNSRASGSKTLHVPLKNTETGSPRQIKTGKFLRRFARTLWRNYTKVKPLPWSQHLKFLKMTTGLQTKTTNAATPPENLWPIREENLDWQLKLTTQIAAKAVVLFLGKKRVPPLSLWLTVSPTNRMSRKRVRPAFRYSQPGYVRGVSLAAGELLLTLVPRCRGHS